MNLGLVLIGFVKLVVGLVLAALTVVLAYRVLARLLKSGHALEENPAAGVLHASSLLSLALLARNSLGALYDTIDLVVHGGAPSLAQLLKVAAHGLLHVGLALVLGTALLALGVWIFNRLTPGVDEVAAVGQGKLGPALVLGAILVVAALLTGPGLEALLAGLVPYPALPSGSSVSPS